MKKLLVILTMLFVITLMYGCKTYSYKYEGEYSDSYTQALHIIPGTRGYIQEEIRFDPEIIILEQDDYGRVLFTYYEGNTISPYSLLIRQYSYDDEVYFYSEKCYISSSENAFDDNEISQLKADNDWNTQINLTKCNCVPIKTSKDPSPLSYEQIKPFYEFVFSSDDEIFSDDRNLAYFKSDQYGRVLVVAEARLADEWAVMMFNLDGTYDSTDGFRIFTSYITYQESFQVFLDDINWNKPL
ncbi:MAG: hypothetical protein WC363_03370 [Candidatus Izemoplasmatales bacterium]|jgi:hypothetical protein|nr:hypothetical protein [Candidatus Izemoplasmatales bacterium]